MLATVQGLFRSLAIAALCASTLSLSERVRAQAEPPPAARDAEVVIASAEYKELVREGMLKYTRGFWPEARAYFLKAHELAPNARTLRGLALVCFDSYHYVDAIDYAEQSLSHPVQPLNDKMIEELKQLSQQAQNLVTRAQLITTPADAELRVDGALVRRRADNSVWLDPGEHDLSVAAPGYWGETRRLQLGEDRQPRLEIALKSRSAETPTRVAAPSTNSPAPIRSKLPWVVVGISGAVAAAGGVMLAVDLAGRGDRDASALTPLGAAMLGVGAVGLVVGLTWSLWPQAESELAASARLQISPLAIQCSGVF
jgi:tetratricopeptide (TPR) repeat protein